MEPEEAIRRFLLDDPYEPRRRRAPSSATSCSSRKDRDGNLRGVRDGSVLYNPAYAPDLCAGLPLAHLHAAARRAARCSRTGCASRRSSSRSSTSPSCTQRGRVALPAPDAPGKYFGMRLNLAAEMEYFSPDDRLSLQRILFYGRGGFDVIDPRHFPYRQPDFRDPAVIQATGNTPVPFMLLLRRMGRERQARLPIDEARAVDAPALRRLRLLLRAGVPRRTASTSSCSGSTSGAPRARPTSSCCRCRPAPRNLQRLKRLFRYDIYQRYYPDAPGTEAYLERIAAAARRQSALVRRRSSRSSPRELAQTPHYVYGSRDRRFAVEAMPALLAEPRAPRDALQGGGRFCEKRRERARPSAAPSGDTAAGPTRLSEPPSTPCRATARHRRSSRSRTSTSASATSSPSSAPTSTSRAASSSRCSARPAAARRRCCA